MSARKVYDCDTCTAENVLPIKLAVPAVEGPPRRVDLCPECAQKHLQSFFSGANKDSCGKWLRGNLVRDSNGALIPQVQNRITDPGETLIGI